MAGKNLSSLLSTVGGVGRLWLFNYGKNWDGTKKIEEMIIPFTTSGVIDGTVDFDLIGKLDMDSVEDAGEDMNVVDHRFTDGSVGVKLVEDGTYGLTCQSMNIAEDICVELLNMVKTTTGSDNTLGKNSLAYGQDGKMGFINPCAIFLETLSSDKYSGILYPYASLGADLQVAGNKTDIWVVNMNIGAQNTPLKALDKTGASKDLTAIWGESTYVLIPKRTETAGSGE